MKLIWMMLLSLTSFHNAWAETDTVETVNPSSVESQSSETIPPPPSARCDVYYIQFGSPSYVVYTAYGPNEGWALKWAMQKCEGEHTIQACKSLTHYKCFTPGT